MSDEPNLWAATKDGRAVEYINGPLDADCKARDEAHGFEFERVYPLPEDLARRLVEAHAAHGTGDEWALWDAVKDIIDRLGLELDK